MDCDVQAFENYLSLLGYDKSQLEYRLVCNFVPAEGELVSFLDEIDVPVFKDPTKFNQTIGNSTGAKSKIFNLLKI